MTETTCPRCGSARSQAATFCGICGQDLRPGAPVRPPEAADPASVDTATSTPAPGAPPAGQAPPRPAVMLPGSTTQLPSEPPAPRPAPAVVPREDQTLSFSERYRGTGYVNPDVERLLPPPPAWPGARRRRRIGLIGLVVGGLLVAAVGGGALFIGSGGTFGPSASASPTDARSGATSRPTPSPTPTIHGRIPDEVEVAACLLLAEDVARAVELATLRADLAAGRTDDLPARIDALAQAIDQSRSSLAALETAPETAALARAWATLHAAEAEALDAARGAATSADAASTVAALKALDALGQVRKAVVDAQAAFVADFPEATCVVEAE